MSRKQIAHLDLDCFFVSVERIGNPSLRGKPVVVGGSPGGRGVVASASYEARSFGIRSAMPTAQALKLCPSLIVVKGRHGVYGDYSARLYHRLLDFAPVVERASIDEMYLDFTGCEALYDNDLPGLMVALKGIVREEFQLPCTIALASNKTLAKIATGTAKPDGVCVVPHGMERSFLAPLPVDVIPGVGAKTSALLQRNGFRLLADLQQASAKMLERLLGAQAEWLVRVANGGGSDTVYPQYRRNSVGHEETFPRDVGNMGVLEKALSQQSASVCSSLRSRHWKAGTVTLKLRYANFHTITRSRSVEPTNDDPLVLRTARELLHTAWDRRMKVRLIGIRASDFVAESGVSLPLFLGDRKRAHALAAVDRIRKKYGSDAIHIGCSTAD